MYRQMYLKDVEIAKKVHIIIGLTTKILNSGYIFFGTDKCQNRQTKTLKDQSCPFH